MAQLRNTPIGSGPAEQALRIGLIVDRAELPAWLGRCVDSLLDLAASNVDAIVELVAPTTDHKPRRFASTEGVLQTYRRIDRRMFGAPNDALRSDTIRTRRTLESLDSAAHIHSSNAVLNERRRLDDAAASSVRASQLDVLLWLAGGIPDSEHGSLAKMGVWCLQIGNISPFDLTLAGLVALMRATVVEINVVATRSSEERFTVDRSVVSTTGPSLTLTCDRLYWALSSLPARAISKMTRSGSGHLDVDADRGTSAPLPQAPSTRMVARSLTRLSANAASRALTRNLHWDQWILGVRRTSGGDSYNRNIPPFKPIVPPKDKYFADPCVVEYESAHYLFFEEFAWATSKGVICCADLSNPSFSASTVLERPYHLSYPFVFRDGDEMFMVPETAEARRIELYRATRFPDSWELVQVLMNDVFAFDSTILQDQGTYWMFVTVGSPGGPVDTDLHLFMAPTVVGPWRPHPKNPVVSDVRHSRPAGRVFLRGGRLIRPAQDCSRRYGRAISFREIEVLSPSDYRERPTGVMDADWTRGLSGIHTWSGDGTFEAVDGLRSTFGLGRKRRRSTLVAWSPPG